MSNFTTIAEYSFKFGPHHHSLSFATTLNNIYSGQFTDAVAESLFTNAAHTAVA